MFRYSEKNQRLKDLLINRKFEIFWMGGKNMAGLGRLIWFGKEIGPPTNNDLQIAWFIPLL